MKRLTSILVVVLVSLLFAFQCNRECCAPPCDTSVLEGSWKLVGYRDNTTWKIDSLPLSDSRSVVFNFKNDDRTGSIDGHTFVNTIAGTYELLDYCRFKVVTFGGSKVGEPELSGKAWLAPETSYHYERVENSLSIQPYMGEEALIFTKN